MDPDEEDMASLPTFAKLQRPGLACTIWMGSNRIHCLMVGGTPTVVVEGCPLPLSKGAVALVVDVFPAAKPLSKEGTLI